MRKNGFYFLILIFLLVVFSGCSAMEQLAPSSFDVAGEIIPGSHELNPTAGAVAHNFGPWGSALAGFPLLVWNFIERAKRNKTEKGLVATLYAINAAKKDTEMITAWSVLKTHLTDAHEVAGITPFIKKVLAKI